MTDDFDHFDEEEDTTPEFQRSANAGHKLVLKLIQRSVKLSHEEQVGFICGLVAGVVDAMWRLREDGRTPEELKRVLSNMVSDFVDEVSEHRKVN